MPHELTSDQQAFIDRIVAEPHTNFRVLGRAGTGKTFLLQHLIRALYSARQWNAAVTPTGAAAVRVETTIDEKKVWATTYNSFLGFRNPGDMLVERDGRRVPLEFDSYRTERDWQFRANVLNNPKTLKKVCDISTLIIEECSMVDADIFERMSQAFSLLRNDMRPFGGVRVVLVGDFKQLRPVMDNFMFTSPLYKEMDFVPLKLETIIRTDEKDYIEFQRAIAVPNGAFLGGLPFVTARWTGDAELGEHTYEYTHLYDYNRDALTWNKVAVQKLFPGASFTTYDLFDATRDWADPRTVELCEGMRVMITMNESKTLSCVNGDIGTIVRFEDVDVPVPHKSGDDAEKVKKRTPIVKLHRNGNEVEVPWKVMQRFDRKQNEVTVFQLPCRPAYAATVHKFQGLTSDGIVVHSRRNEHGKQFVALTRCRAGATLLFHRDDMGAGPRTSFDPSTPAIDF